MTVKKRGKSSDNRTTAESNENNMTTDGERQFTTYYSISRFINYTLIPLLLMLITPNSVMLIWFLCQHCDGSYVKLGDFLMQENIFMGVYNIWRRSNLVTPFSLAVVFGFAAWGALTMIIMPGRTFYGPVTPKGNQPVHRDNGFYCYLLTIFAVSGTTYIYDVTIIYDRFDEIIATLCLFSLGFCLLLYLKGLYYPSSTDSGSSGNFIFDYYWGMELYPRICGLDIKVFTNCRFGMTAWAVLVLIFAMKSYQIHYFVDSIFVSAALQLAYITKFFWWERGYMSTIDIMLDRAGYYICWGCLVFVPGFYTSVSQYLVSHPVHLGNGLACSILLVGVWNLAFNYAADRQKQNVRAKNGDCTIWGQKARYIKAEYRLENGEKRRSILLLSGFWGIARHFHYLPELTLALCWSLPSLFVNVFPYTYFIYLCFLLGHRSLRDDDKCSKKYGRYWIEYKKEVPYCIIPGVF